MMSGSGGYPTTDIRINVVLHGLMSVSLMVPTRYTVHLILLTFVFTTVIAEVFEGDHMSLFSYTTLETGSLYTGLWFF